jgi:hypothetical protein
MTHNLIFAEEPYTLHLLAGSNSITALDAIKALLDAGLHNVNELEPDGIELIDISVNLFEF